MTYIDGGGSQTFGGMRWGAAGVVAACSVALLDPSTGAKTASLGVPLTVAVANNGGTNSDVQITVATDATFTTVIWPGTLTNVVNGNYTVQPTGLVVTTVYYWRARAAPTSTTGWGPWSEVRTFSVDLNVGKAWGYSYSNVGVEVGLWYSGDIEYVFENVGVEVTLYSGGMEYAYENVGVAVTLTSQAVEYAYEGDVNTLTPTPHIWWLIPTAGRAGDGISVFGFGFGDLPGTYGGVLEMFYGGTIGWQALGAISWQTFPANANAYTALRHMDAALGETDMQHQVIECVIPLDAIPPGYPLRVRTEGA